VAATVALLVAATPRAHAGSGRVVNGAAVSPATYASRWSSIASLVSSDERDARKGQFCGGTFIAPQLVVTAAHCVADPNKLLLLRSGHKLTRYNNSRAVAADSLDVIGGRRVLSVRDGQRIDVESIRIHPRYDPEAGSFDIALIKLATPASGASGVVPISPVQVGEDAIWGAGGGVGASASLGPWVGGWGYRDAPSDDFFFSGAQHKPVTRPTKPVRRPSANSLARAAAAKSARSTANTLEEGLVPVASDAACESGGAGQGAGYGRDFDAETMLCAGVLDTHDANDANLVTNGVDSCYGDSGGPLIASTGSTLRLIGIVSFGYGCATRDTFGVYTRVAAFRDFLAQEPKAPVKLVRRPLALGVGEVGHVLRCMPGRWSGAGPISYSYRWVRPSFDGESLAYLFADEAYERLPGTGATRRYQVRPRDRGTRIACLVNASNGSTTAVENTRLVKVPGKPPVDPEDESMGGDDDDEDGSVMTVITL
jgi:hypothetical protein